MEPDGSSAISIIEQPRTLLIPTEQTSNAALALAKLAAGSGLCKTQKVADAFFIIMYGYELGIPAMTALRTIHTINNTPVCSGEAMLALIRRSGKVEIKITGTDKDATVYMKRRETGEEYTAFWTIARAEKAGLMKKPTWQQFTQAFLQWRGVSECGKFLCSDIIGGLYTFEEIAPDLPVDESGEPIDAPVITISKSEPVEQKQPEPPEPEPEWFEPSALGALALRANENGWIEHTGSAGVKELESIIAPRTWSNFSDKIEAGLYIKQVVEDTQAEIERAKQTPISTEAARSLLGNGGNGHERRIPPADVPAITNGGDKDNDYPFSSLDEERQALAKIEAESNGAPVSQKMMTFPQNNPRPISDILKDMKLTSTEAVDKANRELENL